MKDSLSKNMKIFLVNKNFSTSNFIFSCSNKEGTAVHRCSIKKIFWNTSPNSQCGLQLSKKTHTLMFLMFFYKFCKIFQNNLFVEHHQAKYLCPCTLLKKKILFASTVTMSALLRNLAFKETSNLIAN